MIEICYFTDLRRNDRYMRRFRQQCYLMKRLVPGMLRQFEFGMVYRHEGRGVELPGLFDHFFGKGVDVRPSFIVLSAFQYGQIERAEAFPDFFELGTVATVAAQEKLLEGVCST